MDKDNSLTLNELMLKVKSVLNTQFKNAIWIRGELSSYRQSGKHFYGELIDYQNDKKLASARISVWERTAELISSSFFEQTGEKLCAGMKVLLKVEVTFHTVYGLSLNVKDIEPSFTLGDREARKKKIRLDLIKEGVFDRNKKLTSPLDFFNIAVISSSTSAGLGDFESESNRLVEFGLCTFDNYYAKMQGDACNSDVTNVFRTIYGKLQKNSNLYDCIVLIRGGGSETDLDSFNYLEVCRAVCFMQVPVFVGVGHERDSIILDEIANSSFHTPSKVIKYILTQVTSRALKAKKEYEEIQLKSKYIVKSAKEGLKRKKEFLGVTKRVFELKQNELYRMKEVLTLQSRRFIEIKQEKLKQIKKSLVYDSQKVVERKKIENNETFYQISVKVNDKVIINNKNLDTIMKLNRQYALNSIEYFKKEQQNLSYTIIIQFSNSIIRFNEKKSLLYKSILSQSISSTLDRGFCLVKSNNKFITSKKEAIDKDIDTILFYDGEFKINKGNENE